MFCFRSPGICGAWLGGREYQALLLLQMAIEQEDYQSPEFEEGVSCPRCASKLSPERKESLRERQRQMALAKKRNTKHIGKKMPPKPNKRATSCTPDQGTL